MMISTLCPSIIFATLSETNIARPENRPPQKETSLPTIYFQVRSLSSREASCCGWLATCVHLVMVNLSSPGWPFFHTAWAFEDDRQIGVTPPQTNMALKIDPCKRRFVLETIIFVMSTLVSTKVHWGENEDTLSCRWPLFDFYLFPRLVNRLVFERPCSVMHCTFCYFAHFCLFRDLPWKEVTGDTFWEVKFWKNGKL